MVVRLPWQFAGTHLYSWLESGTERVKCISQEHNTLKLRMPDPESSTYLHYISHFSVVNLLLA